MGGCFMVGGGGKMCEQFCIKREFYIVARARNRLAFSGDSPQEENRCLLEQRAPDRLAYSLQFNRPRTKYMWVGAIRRTIDALNHTATTRYIPVPNHCVEYEGLPYLLRRTRFSAQGTAARSAPEIVPAGR